MNRKSRGRIALVLKGYPRLSETFIAQEILELERAGFSIDIISLRHPTDKQTHPVHSEISAQRLYLPEYIYQEPWRILKAKLKCHIKPGFWKAIPVFLKDWLRDPTPNRVRRFAQAMVLASEYANEYDHLYVHFLHTPGSVTRYAAIISGKSFSISAHAKDIWTIPKWEIREKLEDADWLVTCTKGGAEYLRGLADPRKIKLVYHGLDLSRFPSPDAESEPKENKLRFLTVGRAVRKKGIDTLLLALADLDKNIEWKWTHIGGGPLLGDLKQQAAELGIKEKCTFAGALPQVEVLKAYHQNDVFILPSRIDEDGDRDGLPNVIVEAQSQQLPIISTKISGIPELIRDGVNGILVEPDDVKALSGALSELAGSKEKRLKMGRSGETIVRENFDHTSTIGTIITLLDKSVNENK
ncbi:MAG: glycosyltransferase [Pseudomonadota bacterium]